MEIAAHHTGYVHLPGAPVHHRRWRITPDGVEVTDEIRGSGVHAVAYRLLLDATQVQRVTDDGVVCNGCRISVRGPKGSSAVRVVPTTYATGHGEQHEATAIEAQWQVTLPAQVVTTIDLTSID